MLIHFSISRYTDNCPAIAAPNRTAHFCGVSPVDECFTWDVTSPPGSGLTLPKGCFDTSSGSCQCSFLLGLNVTTNGTNATFIGEAGEVFFRCFFIFHFFSSLRPTCGRWSLFCLCDWYPSIHVCVFSSDQYEQHDDRRPKQPYSQRVRPCSGILWSGGHGLPRLDKYRVFPHCLIKKGVFFILVSARCGRSARFQQARRNVVLRRRAAIAQLGPRS